jgi:hypothetical protein
LYLFTDRGYSNTPNHLNQYGTKSKKRKFSNDDEELVHLDIKGETFNILVEEARAQKRQSDETFMLKLMYARSENELRRLKLDNAALRMKIDSLTSENNKGKGLNEVLQRKNLDLRVENSKLTMCIICFNPISDCAFAAKPCNHAFCATCFETNAECFICKKGKCAFEKIFFL